MDALYYIIYGFSLQEWSTEITGLPLGFRMRRKESLNDVTLDAIIRFATKELNSANVTPRNMTGGSLTSVDDGADLPGNDIMSILLLPSLGYKQSKKINGFELLTP